MNLSLGKIKLALQEEDVEGLIELGAPDDEYDSEATAIVAALDATDDGQLTQSMIVAIIAVVWAESFGCTEEEIKQRMPAFMNIAKQVLI